MNKRILTLVIISVCFGFRSSLAAELLLNPPIAGGEITSDFGPRIHNGYNWHGGIDYSASTGTPVYAVESGEIIDVGCRRSGPVLIKI